MSGKSIKIELDPRECATVAVALQQYKRRRAAALRRSKRRPSEAAMELADLESLSARFQAGYFAHKKALDGDES